MRSSQKHFGTCRICGVDKELSYEHVPPRIAFNKTTRHVSVPHDEWTKIDNFLEYKPKGKILQGGIGYYSLCRDCNSFLGQNYVKAYEQWVLTGIQIISKYKVDYFNYVALQQEPLKILKQIISMFIAMNDKWYLEEYPELASFVKDPNSNILPDKFRVFAYLNNQGQYRYFKHGVISQPGLGIINATELAFPPFGYVLTFDFAHDISHFQNITSFKSYKLGEKADVEMFLYKLPTYLPFSPLDYRSKDKIDADTKASR
ncbi:MAG: hypothetical protein Q8L81_14300 [Bacteroidota bacterium]|nr:hypothetical protein [Bacteroidota bacterium]